jgi:hypothetical protein
MTPRLEFIAYPMYSVGFAVFYPRWLVDEWNGALSS